MVGIMLFLKWLQFICLLGELGKVLLLSYRGAADSRENIALFLK